MVAAEALARGVESPALVEVACLHRSEGREAAELFLVALGELGLVDAGEKDWERWEIEVTVRRAKEHAARIVDGSGHPGELAGHIAALLISLESEAFDGCKLLGEFEYLHVLWAEGYHTIEALTEDIQLAARKLLDAQVRG